MANFGIAASAPTPPTLSISSSCIVIIAYLVSSIIDIVIIDILTIDTVNINFFLLFSLLL